MKNPYKLYRIIKKHIDKFFKIVYNKYKGGCVLDSFFRIQSITLTNFKNVKNGEIEFSDYGKKNLEFENNITAIYGQNGSGKTALIDAVSLIKRIICKGKLPNDMDNYIKKGETTATVSSNFFVSNKEIVGTITYTITFQKTDHGVIISEEILSAKEFSNGEWKNNTEIIHYSIQPVSFSITPVYLYKDLTKSNDYALELLLSQSLCAVEDEKTKRIECSSLLFSNRFIDLLKKIKTKSPIIRIIAVLSEYVTKNILIVSDTDFGGISENVHAIPIYIKQYYNKSTGGTVEAVGTVPIEINNKTVIPAVLKDIYENFVKQINSVLPSIIPGIAVEIIDIQKEYNENNQQFLSFSVVTVRNNERISLKYESAGIKKVLCIISSLIATFNNSDMCFVVDELDSGLFEYLLGQIITVFNDNGKGQLIFTSHNLHVMEILDTKSIIITTWNGDNCYKHLSGVQTNNNKRLLYLKQIELSDDEGDIIYNETNQYKMSYAFKKAYQIAKEGVTVE